MLGLFPTVRATTWQSRSSRQTPHARVPAPLGAPGTQRALLQNWDGGDARIPSGLQRSSATRPGDSSLNVQETFRQGPWRPLLTEQNHCRLLGPRKRWLGGTPCSFPGPYEDPKADEQIDKLVRFE